MNGTWLRQRCGDCNCDRHMSASNSNCKTLSWHKGATNTGSTVHRGCSNPSLIPVFRTVIVRWPCQLCQRLSKSCLTKWRIQGLESDSELWLWIVWQKSWQLRGQRCFVNDYFEIHFLFNHSFSFVAHQSKGWGLEMTHSCPQFLRFQLI